eukprot:TRINITY_DN2194_c0_g1_i1.p1 TRINITY_DN2194_c0_g1~~TRINITY_DN2194_c0_g1_i1.p1  ORF type:complete len:633 (-),score=86.24 TRINITY_DN2194_c0_g1_i1:6-1904(-)
MLKTYPQCFIASELVEWLLKQKITETREQAVGLSSYLVDKQSFHAVNSEHKFKDEDLYFTFDDLETSQKNLSDSKARATSRTSAPTKPSLNTLIKQALSSQPGTGTFLPTVGEGGPPCRVCKFELNEKWNFCPNCATHVNRDLDVLDASQKLIKEQAEKIQQLHGADTLITNLQTQIEDLRKQNDGLKAKLDGQQSKPFDAAIQPTLVAQQKPAEEQPAPIQQPTLAPQQQTPVQPIQPTQTPVTVAPTPVTPTQPTTVTPVTQPTPVAKEPEPVKEEPKPQPGGPKSSGFVMPPPKIIAKETTPSPTPVQPTQAAATTPQKGGWATSAPSSNPGSLHTSNEANTNNNLAANTTAPSNPTPVATPTTPATNTTAPLNTSGSNNTAATTTTPATTNPQPAASGWTKARVVPSGGGFTPAVPKGFVAQPTTTTSTTTTVTQQQVSEPRSAPLNKEPLPKQQNGDVEVIKTTYGKKAVVKQLTVVETKIKSDAELGIDSSNFDSIVGSQFSHITGPISAIITGTVQRPETLGSAKLATLYQVDVFRGQFEWTVFRRFGQFKDLDKSWKSKKVKVIPLPIFSKKADPEAKRDGVEKYLHNLLMNDDTALHPILVNFLLPIQMDDTKPRKMDNLTLN